VRFTTHFKAIGTLVGAIYTIDKIYEDDKLGWDDTPAIMTFIGGTAIVWAGDFLDWKKIHKKPLYIIEVAILAGGVVSYMIGGREGLVAYTDILTGKIGPTEWYEVVAPEVKREVKETYHTTVGFAGMLIRMVGTEVQRKVDQAEAVYDWITEDGIWLNPTPGYRLF